MHFWVNRMIYKESPSGFLAKKGPSFLTTSDCLLKQLVQVWTASYCFADPEQTVVKAEQLRPFFGKDCATLRTPSGRWYTLYKQVPVRTAALTWASHSRGDAALALPSLSHRLNAFSDTHPCCLTAEDGHPNKAIWFYLQDLQDTLRALRR